jgi:polyisoprenoid-binding protein YceI
VSIPAGIHTFGPENGALWVLTTRTGAAAAAGHNLVIQVTAWEATFEAGADPTQTSVVFAADATSLRVREGTGGMQPLGDVDKESIQESIDDEVLKRTAIDFRSTSVQIADDGSRIHVQGDLTLVGQTRPLSFDLEVGDDGRISGRTIVTQSNWGIAPYSTLFGALKVGDDVEIVIDLSLRGSAAGEPDLPDSYLAAVPGAALVDPNISSSVWATVFGVYLWFGMASIGVSAAAALALALAASFPIFVFVRTRGVSRQPPKDAAQSL